MLMVVSGGVVVLVGGVIDSVISGFVSNDVCTDALTFGSGSSEDLGSESLTS
jgi:hypothetical protein